MYASERRRRKGSRFPFVVPEEVRERYCANCPPWKSKIPTVKFTVEEGPVSIGGRRELDQSELPIPSDR